MATSLFVCSIIGFIGFSFSFACGTSTTFTSFFFGCGFTVFSFGANSLPASLSAFSTKEAAISSCNLANSFAFIFLVYFFFSAAISAGVMPPCAILRFLSFLSIAALRLATSSVPNFSRASFIVIVGPSSGAGVG